MIWRGRESHSIPCTTPPAYAEKGVVVALVSERATWLFAKSSMPLA
jgi:hypothetical protein